MMILRCAFVFVLLFVSITVPARAELDLRTLFESGVGAYQQGEYAEAIKIFEKTIEVNPNFAPVYNYLGLAHQAMGDASEEVIWFFKVALDIDPEYAEAHHNICKTHYQDGKHHEAEKACRKALAIDPDMGSAQLSLAWIYLVGKEQPAMAIPYFRDVLERVDNPMVYFGLGMAYAQNGDRVQVLDVITTLRSQGEDRLAAQLEQSIRTPEVPETMAPRGPQDLLPPTRQAGTIVGAAGDPKESLPVPAANSTSTVRIRLKGQLLTQPASDDASVAPPGQPVHPGSLSEE